MQFPLIAAVTLALLGFVWAVPNESDKRQFCNFLKNVEEDRGDLLNSLEKKALATGKSVIPLLGRNSSFEAFMNENLTLQLNKTSQQQVDFILNFRCAFKNKILTDERYKSNPDIQKAYKNYRSGSNQEIAEFDLLLSLDLRRMLKKMQNSSPATNTAKQEFQHAVVTYLVRKGKSAHCLMNDFLKLNEQFKCNVKDQRIISNVNDQSIIN